MYSCITKGAENEITEVVYHVHGVTVWLTLWENGKEFEISVPLLKAWN